jgi:hypothetical protein
MKNLNLSKLNWKKKKTIFNFPGVVLLLSILLITTRCAVSLAPRFDQGIIDNLSITSTEVFQLLSEVSDGTTNADFNKREEEYNQVIGKLDALALQINARPVPDNKTVDKIISKANSSLQKKGTTLISVNQTAPSATALKNVTANVTKMKQTDKLQGITATEALAFKNNIELFFDQALTYERFLNK